MTNVPSGTITFLFTDIEGSTRLWESQPDAMKPALARHDALLREAIEGRGGYVFKTVGDAFCAAFAEPSDALEAALAAQRSLLVEKWASEIGSIRVRMAIHTGVAEEREGDYFGQPVNRVARLLSAGHGGQTLISVATQELIRDSLPEKASLLDMGEHRLKDLLRPERIYQINAPDLPSEFAPLKTLDLKLTNLPSQPTPFIGREKEITETLELLRRKEVNLVTLTGPGGTGKTRLSLQVAGELLDEFRDGVYFVALGDASDRDVALSKIALALAVREGGSQPMLDSLKDYLQDKSLLLVWDNFEQLVGAASIAADLLAAAPGLKLLISSQIVLRVRGEHEYPLAPLATPNLSNLPPLDQLQQNESIQLFLQRARSVNSKFELTAENAPAVAEICQRLEGLPLAIELAAARIKLLSPQAMVAKLNDRLGLLTGGARDLPARQQTLRNALDWSHSLLADQEKALFARLGIFLGGFSLDAAEAVCNPDGSMDVLGGVEVLLNNSLLRQEEDDSGQTRFRMLESIREYAAEELGKTAELADIQRAHAMFYLTKVAGEIGFKLFSAESVKWLNWLEVEHDNLRSALAWSQATTEADGMKSMLLLFLSWFWYRRGYLSEGRAWGEAFLEQSGQEIGSRLRAGLLMGNSLMAVWQGEPEKALALAEEGFPIMLRSEDDPMIAFNMLGLGIIHINRGDHTAALPLLTQGAEMFRQGGNDFFYATIMVHLGNAALGAGKPGEAREWHEKAYPIAKKVGDEWVIAFALNNLGEVARVNGDYAKARRYYEECEVLLRQSGDTGDLARLVHSLGYVAQHEGDLAQAQHQFSESLAMFRKFGNHRGMAECVIGFAGLHALKGQHQQAVKLMSAAETILTWGGARWWPADQVEIDRTRAMLSAALDEAAFKEAWEAGSRMTRDEAFALALE
jgi:predicted ATPase/class 3 adenylate cyclase